MNTSWKLQGLSLATTAGVAYLLCAVYDWLFAPYGVLRLLAPAIPWPIMGSPVGVLGGFVLFTVVGGLLGVIYGIALGFWSKRLETAQP